MIGARDFRGSGDSIPRADELVGRSLERRGQVRVGEIDVLEAREQFVARIAAG